MDIITIRTRQSAQAGESHWPVLLKNVILSSIGIRATNQPEQPVLSIAFFGRFPAENPFFIRPFVSIRQLMPVLTLLMMDTLFSTALKAQMAACWANSVDGRIFSSLKRTNQPSLLIFISQSSLLFPFSSRVNFSAIAGTVSS